MYQDTGKVITTENRTELASSVYNRWHNRKFHPSPSPTPVLERHRIPHPGVIFDLDGVLRYNFTTGLEAAG